MSIIYQIAADLILILHLCFVIFALFGGLLILRWRWIIWLHIPAIVWGVVVQVFVLICPLTPLENRLREMGGEEGYSAGFIEHYISMILYSGVSPNLHWLLGFSLLGINLSIYYYVFTRRNKIA